MAFFTYGGTMIIRTRVFDIANNRFQNLSELAKAMGISVSQVYRVREGKRGINEKFIVGAKMAFPDLRLDELFYFNSDRSPERVSGKSEDRPHRSIQETVPQR
jgi:transcriptional regulator with XRE-family HTH domain